MTEVLWHGRPIETYTKLELVEILTLIALENSQLEAELQEARKAASSGFLRQSLPQLNSPLSITPQPGDRS